MTAFSTYATYIRGLPDLEGPIHGLLTMSEEALRFETFDRKRPLEALLPEPWRSKEKPVEVIIPRAEIARVTDLDGRISPKPRPRLARLLSWLNLEPNGICVEWGEKRVVFDCERRIDSLLG